MKIKTTLLAIGATALIAVSAQAAIILNYNNATGDYEVFGGDSGIGITVTNTDYLWQFTNSAYTVDANDISTAIRSDGLTGQLDGTPATLSGNTTLSNILVWSFSPAVAGPLTLDSKSGTIASGLWAHGDGTFIATAAHPNIGENFTLTVGAVPEPSTYAALLGLAVMGFVAYRRRKA